jgi:hypothetical protein
MRWFKSDLRSSLFAIFASGQAPAPEDSVPAVGVEDIRDAMLALIGDLEDKRFAHVCRRIRCANDAVGLWYLRSDLMAALASRDGEAQARERLRTITEMFEHLLPQGLKSRPSPLAALASKDDPGAVPN